MTIINHNLTKSNFFHKNLRQIRNDRNLTQEAFGKLFQLTKSNVMSYEREVSPKLEKFIEITRYFGVDPEKMFYLDMTKDSILKGKNAGVSPEVGLAPDMTEQILSDLAQIEYLETLDEKEIMALYLKERKARLHLTNENMELKTKYIRLLEKERKQAED